MSVFVRCSRLAPSDQAWSIFDSLWFIGRIYLLGSWAVRFCQLILRKSNPYSRAEALKPTLASPLKGSPTTHHEDGRALLFTFAAPLHIFLSGLAVAGVT